MNYKAFCDEISNYYLNQNDADAQTFSQLVCPILDAAVTDDMSAYARKVLQYEVISQQCIG